MAKSNSEVWKPITDYENLYLVSDHGNVFGVKRGKCLRKRLSPKGYPQVNLSKDGKLHTFRVHRLVATHFVPNPYNLPEVNHIDEDKCNNKVSNLEWCDRAYNVTYGNGMDKRLNSVRKPVVQFSKTNGEPLAAYESASQAQRTTGIRSVSISECCRGIRKSAGGFKWQFAKEVSA